MNIIESFNDAGRSFAKVDVYTLCNRTAIAFAAAALAAGVDYFVFIKPTAVDAETKSDSICKPIDSLSLDTTLRDSFDLQNKDQWLSTQSAIYENNQCKASREKFVSNTLDAAFPFGNTRRYLDALAMIPGVFGAGMFRLIGLSKPVAFKTS